MEKVQYDEKTEYSEDDVHRVLENENEMDNFKKEFMALIDKYCQPEVAYEVYSDKDIEEEVKWEEEYERELLKDIQKN